MQLSVIIVNYNVKFFLEQCLSSVIRAITEIEAEIIVIDNLSTDGSREYFKDRFHQVTFIWNKENIGFGRANNLGLKHATGELVLFLNPDTILPENCLKKCLGVLASKPTIGALGIKMIDGTGQYLKESKRGFPTPMTSLFKLLGLTGMFPHSAVFARYYMGNLDASTNHIVDVLAGAFMITRRTALDQVAGFDEDFFMYGEDIDLSYRIQQAGYKNYYYADSAIIHFKGESTQKGSIQYARSFYGAMALFVEKHFGSGRAGAYRSLIKGAIHLKSILWRTGRLFERAPVVKPPAPYVLVGDKAGLETARSILTQAGIPKFLAGYIDTVNILGLEDSEAAATLIKSIKAQPAAKIIFCVNGLKVKQVISLITQLGPQYNYRFHLAGTGSIVGSDNKEFSGECLSLDGPGVI